MTETVVATPATKEAPAQVPPHESDRSRAENRLGLRLVAPAVILMVLVTAYPMLQALYLSLFRYRLTTPGDKKFIGLSNYLTVLGDSLFWSDM
ncbi:MAG: trehalose/maltose transport system permease protein, partial [Nocardioidaceae bacterium]|nr:trehalose/maltose transport system permease protein [Nocardioidaceae bacterium]